jgi:hypothetical protein
MKKIILLAATLMIVGCEHKITDDSNNTRENPWKGTLVKDSCEYVYNAFGLAHKGNCRFCEERDSIKWEKRKKELEELIIKLKEK